MRRVSSASRRSSASRCVSLSAMAARWSDAVRKVLAHRGEPAALVPVYLDWIDRGPELSVPGARVYPPQVKSDLAVRPEGITGSRTWEFVVVPQTTGTLEIPSLTFSYFDPATRAVVRSTTPPLPLRVAGAPGAVCGK